MTIRRGVGGSGANSGSGDGVRERLKRFFRAGIEREGKREVSCSSSFSCSPPFFFSEFFDGGADVGASQRAITVADSASSVSPIL